MFVIRNSNACQFYENINKNKKSMCETRNGLQKKKSNL